MKALDWVGKRFGRLVVLRDAEATITKAGVKRRRVLVLCDCGAEKVVKTHHLNQLRSCGCLSRRLPVGPDAPKGFSYHPLYPTWLSMKARCLNPQSSDFHKYGARGITVCEKWANSFTAFLQDMGERPLGSTLERIDNNKGYSPENCCWATSTQQSRNRRTSHKITAYGATKTIAEWAENTGINKATIHNRIKSGWGAERAVSTPPKGAKP